MKYAIFIIIPFLTVKITFGQDEPHQSPFTISGYVDVYYGYDFNQSKNNTRPLFMYSYNRHHEVNLNLGFLKGAYSKDRVRANLALMAGTYANANLAAEPDGLKNIYEANAGVKISSTKNLWIDAGIFASHIGFESAIGNDCWNLTRSILADNSPYYETGAKISYTTDNDKWFFSGLILNGWQRIQRVEGDSLPSVGTQITFKPGETITLNSSSFIGTDKPDSARQMRYFHNFYGTFQVAGSIGVTVGFDYGAEEESPESSAKNLWFSPVIIAKFTLSNKVAIALRGEYYDDEHGVIIPLAPGTGTPNGFKTIGVSANLDYHILSNAVWRIEARHFSSKDEIFQDGEGMSKGSTFVTSSLAVSF